MRNADTREKGEKTPINPESKQGVQMMNGSTKKTKKKPGVVIMQATAIVTHSIDISFWNSSNANSTKNPKVACDKEQRIMSPFHSFAESSKYTKLLVIQFR